jgi:hypothetical protein
VAGVTRSWETIQFDENDIMSSNSLETLLAWMKDTSRMLRWGMVFALERRKANLLMAQEYMRRFEVGSYLPPVRGDVEIVENQWVQVIHDFVMDIPLLSFENADLNDSKARLSMSVVGGTQLSLKRESAGYKAVLVDEIDSLQGPKLYLDLLLDRVPGNVDEDGRIILDLSRSDNFRLTFGPTEDEQRLGGDFFKDLFNQLAPEKRIWPLGRIERGTVESMHPQSFALRTQASGAAARDPQSSEHGNGAILTLVRMEGDAEGDFPGTGFRYLIPDDAGKDYSATVLFDWARLSPSVGWQQKLVDAVKRVFGDDLEYEYNGGQLKSVSVKSGGITVGGATVWKVPMQFGGNILWVTIRREASFVPANGTVPFKVTFNARGASIRWQSEATENSKLYYQWVGGKEEGPHDLNFGMIYDLEAVYGLVDGTGVDGAIEPVFKAVKFDFTATPVLPDKPRNIDFGAGKDLEDALIGLIVVTYVVYLQALHLGIVGLLVNLHLSTQMYIRVRVKPIIDELIKLNFGQTIESDQIRSPFDIAYFGRVNPSQTSFLISPMRPQMLQGDTQQFSTEPAIQGVQWAVENLPEDSGNPGTISASGLYQAPAAASIEGRFKRVRVTATHPSSGYHSSALVTVLLDELSVHPLIQICDLDTSVELAAGALREGELIWSIKNPVANESGELRPSEDPEGDYTYHHGPKVSNKTYVLDEIEVKNSRTNKTRSVHVLALQKAPFLSVEILHTDSEQGQVRLQASYNGSARDVEWSLPLGGPGSIDSTGLYRVAPTATERFVLIFALMADTPIGDLEGHLILPLPLVEFPQLLEVLSQ